MPYFSTLRCLADANALFIPGSDDRAYTASKLYPYVLAKKPLLAIFHEASSVTEILRTTRAGCVVTFNDSHNLPAVSRTVSELWFSRWPPPAPTTDWEAFAPYTARSMTQKLCSIFDHAVARKN
jgi:hypothetical protein